MGSGVEVLIVMALLAINLIGGIAGTMGANVWSRVSLFLAGGLAIQLVHLLTGAI